MTPILLQSSSPSPTQTAILIAFGLILLIYLMARSKRKRRDPLDDSSAGFSVSRQRTLERDMQNLVVDLNEMARQISAQLDTRSKRLEVLIAEADAKLAELRQTMAGAAVQHMPAASGAETLLPDEAESLTPNGPAHATSEAEPETIDPRHAEIYQLADEGVSAHDIARRLDRPSGEVQLILALRSRRTPISEATSS